MTVLSRIHHDPIIAEALTLARRWCHGHTIDGAPALAHAVKVAVKLGEHIPAAPAELVAAALLHDAPEYAHPADQLDTTLTGQLGSDVTRIVRALQREHHALDAHAVPHVPVDDPPVLYASVADKIVSLTSVLQRAKAAQDPAAYWRARSAFRARIPYFRAFHTAATPHLPASMADELDQLTTQAERNQ